MEPELGSPFSFASTPRVLALIPVLLVVLGLAACGSSPSSSTPRSTTSTGSATGSNAEAATPRHGIQESDHGGAAAAGSAAGGSEREASNGASGGVPGDTSAHFKPRVHHDSGGGAAQFEEKGGDNSIQEFGAESSGSEFEQAAATLHDYLDARAAHAWAASCRYLAPVVVEQLAQLASAGGANSGKGSKPSCARLVAGLSAGVPSSALREAAVADVGALRVRGRSAFLLFVGPHGARFFVPMAREGDRWKVAAIAPSAVG